MRNVILRIPPQRFLKLGDYITFRSIANRTKIPLLALLSITTLATSPPQLEPLQNTGHLLPNPQETAHSSLDVRLGAIWIRSERLFDQTLRCAKRTLALHVASKGTSLALGHQPMQLCNENFELHHATGVLQRHRSVLLHRLHVVLLQLDQRALQVRRRELALRPRFQAAHQCNSLLDALPVVRRKVATEAHGRTQRRARRSVFILVKEVRARTVDQSIGVKPLTELARIAKPLPRLERDVKRRKGAFEVSLGGRIIMLRIQSYRY